MLPRRWRATSPYQINNARQAITSACHPDRLFERANVSRLFELLPVKNWYLLFFGVPVCWNLFNFLTASPVSRHLYFIWSALI